MVLALGVVVATVSGPLSGQEDTLPVAPGVVLGMSYDVQPPRTLVVRPFRGDDPALETGAIVARDLELSDRFSVLESPEALVNGPPDFEIWDGMSVDYIVDGEVEIVEGRPVVRVTVHDVLYARILERGEFAVPSTGARGFRLAVHGISDAVVWWVTGEPGMAASRVAFMRRTEDGGMDLMVVDSDGEGLRRAARFESLAYSPAWSPDGDRIVHTRMDSEGSHQVVERNLATGEARVLAVGPGLPLMPAYSPDGSRLTLAISSGPREDLYEYDLTSGDLRRVRARALAPGYSSDGRFLAFGSDRLGTHQIWIVPRSGGDPVLVSPFGADTRSHFELPDWSPVAPLLAFHGGRALAFQVLVVDVTDPERQVRQLTREGWSESPSWAPDGRHLVVHGVRGGRAGLYVLDSRTGRTRLLVGGSDVRTPDWSPGLAPRPGGDDS